MEITMNFKDTKPPATNICSGCGAEFPVKTTPGICPKCLLKAGLPSQSVTLQQDFAPARPSRTMPQPNEQFGHYRIIRQIGQGGMGAVFEAEDLENGRRLALKIMSHTLDSRDTRARFLREGRLAASINHPNSVYIFGTEEIAGMPIIVMELVTGGTLQGLVKKKGPLPATEAADYILQIIDGLEAAQRVGVLHRDIKPSNCFMDSNGKVKIGDFGLSINTVIRLEPTLTATGAFMGTPAFSSPEQLRGDELTVRSDIYALGVTFYYLLTGTLPFDAPNLPQLLATILERPVESPAKRRNTVPEGLSQIVLHCLEKNPDKRFQNYNELRQGLLPYASTAPVPATLGKRFIAHYLLDISIISLFFYLPFRFYVLPRYMDTKSTEGLLTSSMFSFFVSLLYFTLSEGLWGTTCGKALRGLRVIRANRDRPGLLRALGRFVIFTGPIYLVALAGLLISLFISNIFFCQGKDLTLTLSGQLRGGLLNALWPLLMFITIRKRNGWAAIHDLLTGTRVVQKSAHPLRQPTADTQPFAPASANLPQIGPYQALETLPVAADGREWLLGYDARLLRKVWIRKMKPDDPSVSQDLKNLGRAGRLRWLNGKRSPAESWDAYEAFSGKSLVNLIRHPQSWEQVRFWLMDLAEELQAAQADGTLPEALRLERVWITEDNHAELLDFPAPGTSEDYASTAIMPQDFLRQIAVSALEGRPTDPDESSNKPIAVPMALHARAFLDALPKTADLKKIFENLKSLLSKTAVVTRSQHLVLALGYIAGMAIPFFGMVLGVLIPFNAHGYQFLLTQEGIFMCLATLCLMSIFPLGTAVLFRGGLFMHLAGIMVANRRGTIASRGRIFWRYCIVILPAIALTLLCLIGSSLFSATIETWEVSNGCMVLALLSLAGSLVVILTIISILLPKRSLQDRLAGTWLVPK